MMTINLQYFLQIAILKTHNSSQNPINDFAINNSEMTEIIIVCLKQQLLLLRFFCERCQF